MIVRRLVVSLVALASGAAVLSGCSDSSQDASVEPQGNSSSETQPTSSTAETDRRSTSRGASSAERESNTSGSGNKNSSDGTAQNSPRTNQPSPEVVSVAVANGRVVFGGDPVNVKQGQRVVVRITSDAADTMHVHGYDVVRELRPNQPVVIDFVADIPGKFVAELHDSHLTLFRLEVR